VNLKILEILKNYWKQLILVYLNFMK